MSTFDNPFDPELRLKPAASAGGTRARRSMITRRATRSSAPPAERGEALRGRGRLGGDARRVPAGQDAPRLPQVGRRLDRACRPLAVLPAQDRDRGVRPGGPIEKKDLKVGFIPITCATPIIMAHPMGFYAKHGLNVEVIKTAGWAVIRDKTLNKEYDAAHMLSPMPLAITLGAGSTPVPYTMPAVENINGQAITLAVKHKDKRDPEIVEGVQVRRPVRLLDAQLPAALLRRRARARSRHRHPDPRGAAARDGRQPARRQYRRLPRPRSVQPARGL